MGVSSADVERMAMLARLRLEPAELHRMTDELNVILEHIAELGTLDVANVEAYANAAETPAPLRLDEPGADPLRADLETLAPGWHDGFFTVPRLAAQRGRDSSIEERPD